nr:MAG TPA: hypothetical protein [Caudoviricetes sp.]DAI94570.1 MAG TPA: hypothetical protein [Caudoviricetes sp.]
MQKINLKKTTKEQMLNMLETAWQANAGANEEIAALSKRIDEQNDALAKCVAEKNELRDQARDARGNAEYWHGRFNNAFNITEVQRQKIKEDAEELRRERVNVETMTDQRNAAIAENKDLRTKLADTEAALGRANALCVQFQSNLTLASEACYNAEQRTSYVEAHPWRNLWAWAKKKKLGCAE